MSENKKIENSDNNANSSRLKSINNHESLKDPKKKNISKKKNYDLNILDWFFDKGWMRVKKTDF